MQIITADIRHLDQIWPLFEAYRAFYRQPADRAGARPFIAERLSKQESIIYLASTQEQEVVGFTQLYPLFSSTRLARVWLLNDLFVKPEFRGLGVSLRLIDAAKSLALAANAAGLLLETEKTNEIGNNLYPRAGFVIEDDTNHYFWKAEKTE